MDYRYEYYPKPVSLLRIKKIPKPQQMELVNMADQVMSAKDNDATTDTSVLEWEIDQLVYRLYGLTDEEIAVVEESVGR